jgi:hypothetical protein
MTNGNKLNTQILQSQRKDLNNNKKTILYPKTFQHMNHIVDASFLDT